MPKGSSSGAQKSSLPAICKGATILVVDDDPSVLSAFTRLIRAAGFQVKAFDRPSALRASEVPKTKACMIVDVVARRRLGGRCGSARPQRDRALRDP